MKNIVKLLGTQGRLFCAIALLAIIGFSMAACGGGDESVSLPGTTWKGNLTSNGVTISATLKFTASAYTLAMTAPGTTLSQTESGTYTFNGHSGVLKSTNGSTEDFNVSGDKLTLIEGKDKYTLTKQK